MSEKYIKKNIELSLEFDSYIARHPHMFDDIPHGSTVIITLSGDDEFNETSISIVRKSRSRKPVVEARKSGTEWNLMPLQLKAA